MTKFKIIQNYHLIIPAICIGFWAIAYLLQNHLIFCDFRVFYNGGKQIFIDPANLYDVQGYYYAPSFALVFSISISLFPFFTAYVIFFILNYIFGVLIIIEYNKILILMGIKKKAHRFLFLIIISNGGVIMDLFYYNQTKFLALLFLFIVLRREYQTLIEKNEKDLKYIIINYNLLLFAIGLKPYLVFLLPIYLFYDINFNELFKKKNIKIYCIIMLISLAQNFLFIIYPSLFLDFISSRSVTKIFYLYEFIALNAELVFLLSFIIMFTVTFFLICIKKLSIIKKFGYFALFSIFFSFFAHNSLIILLPLTLLLFVPFLNKKEKFVDFIKSNKILLLGLLAIYGLYQWIFRESVYRYFPFMANFPYIILVDLRFIILLSIMVGTLIFLGLRHFKETNTNEVESTIS